jgi:hypothetical protein
MLTGLLDHVRKFLNAGIIWIDLIKIDLLGRCKNVIADIIKSTREIVDILTIEWRYEISSKFSEDAMCQIVVHMFQILNLGNQ